MKKIDHASLWGRILMISRSVIRKSTPILQANRIESVIDFWMKLGVTPIIQVPNSEAADGSLAFVILEAQGIEVMYQTDDALRLNLLKVASAGEAFPAIAQRSILHVSVTDLAKVEDQLLGERLIIPRRILHGTIETGYADPAGNLILFVEYCARDSEPPETNHVH